LLAFASNKRIITLSQKGGSILMAKSQSLSSMSVDALLKLRDNIGHMLTKKAADLRRQLSALTGSVGGNDRKRGRKAGSLKGRKVAPKFRGPGGETWAGRGATPRWMADAVKGGAKKEDFLIAGTASAHKKPTAKKASRKRKTS
jgi:DNA-binding protein H-NS